MQTEIGPGAQETRGKQGIWETLVPVSQPSAMVTIWPLTVGVCSLYPTTRSHHQQRRIMVRVQEVAVVAVEPHIVNGGHHLSSDPDWHTAFKADGEQITATRAHQHEPGADPHAELFADYAMHAWLKRKAAQGAGSAWSHWKGKGLVE